MDNNQTPSRFNNKDMDEYFAALPPHIQESIMQAVPQPKTTDELKSIAHKFYF